MNTFGTWQALWHAALAPPPRPQSPLGRLNRLGRFLDVPETQIQTKYGTACGRPYPLSDRFLGDMQQLAQTYAGDRNGLPLYVT
ncbi:MAG: hypothetical protein M3R61_17295, partial [Chloroflexota bacterium]|nr:hypothetical protein [Chloroflexota bacterium]